MSHIYSIDGLVPVVHPTAFVHPTAVLIGDVLVGPRCYVGPGASLRGDMGRLIVGEGANVQDNCVVHCFPGNDTVIEADGHVGHGAVLHGCIVRRGALIGMHAVVMDRAVIGEQAFVAAMAFVKAGTEVAPRTLVAGIPARTIREVGAEELKWKAEGTATYQRLAERSLASLRPATPLTEPEPDRPRLTPEGTAPLHVTKQR